MIVWIIFGVIIFLILFYYFLELKSKMQLNKLRREYNAERDASRKPGADGRTQDAGDKRDAVDSELALAEQPALSVDTPNASGGFKSLFRRGRKAREQPSLKELEEAVKEKADDEEEQVN
jgi:hypothetical protein